MQLCGKVALMEFARDRSAEVARQAAERAIRHLAQDVRVQLVYLFGSTVDPGRARVRDVDLAVLTDPPLSLDELLQLQADLGAATGAAIDLVSLNDAPVVLAHEVADSGRCLFARDADVEVEFVTGVRARYWDFKPFLDEQWRLAGERLKEREGGSPT
jgi:predicted nucleotidyltransferase